MSLKNYKIKANKKRNDGSFDFPQFSISYNLNTKNASSKAGYDILSLLKGDSDIVIDVNNSLFISSQNVDQDFYTGFINNIRALSLDYSYRRVPSLSKQNLFSGLFGNSKNESAHEIIVYVPHEKWMDKSFCDILPIYGVRYYMTKAPEDGNELITKMTRMIDSEKLDYFKIIAFDVAAFGQIGVKSNYLRIDDIKDMLGKFSSSI